MANSDEAGRIKRICRWRMLAASGLLMACSVHAAPPESRDEAVRALESAEVEARREAVSWLAQRGGMDDLPSLAGALRDEHPDVREEAEGALVRVWSRSGDARIDALLKAGIEQMSAGLMGQAVDTFSRIIDNMPEFAEGWNKRATAYFLLGQYELSLRDCDEVMARNPFHFGALSGYGMIYVQMGQLERALEYFERALEVNPNLAGAQTSAGLIRQRLGQQGKQAT